MKIKKINHRAKSHPIDNIAGCAADDEADRNSEKTAANPVQPDREDNDHGDGSARKQQRADPGAVENPKTDAAVAGQHQVEKRGQRLLMADAAALVEMQQQQAFAELIEKRDRHRDGKTAPEHSAASLDPRPSAASPARGRGRSGGGGEPGAAAAVQGRKRATVDHLGAA